MRSPLLNLPRETMPNLAIQYLTDRQGNPNAVVIPIAVWKQKKRHFYLKQKPLSF